MIIENYTTAQFNNTITLNKVPEYEGRGGLSLAANAMCIIDLETTGLDYNKDKITEIGIIKVAYSSDLTNASVMGVYKAFNDPGIPISEKITKLTGITYEMVEGKYINWQAVEELVKGSTIVCHNAPFDRKFLEEACDIFKGLQFACTKNDIDWTERGYGSNKLDYLNWKLGYFYDAHRAINDCWATLNLLVQEQGAVEELICNRDKTTYEVYALNTPYNQKDILKENGFYWNDGSNGKPKAWYKVTDDKYIILDWLSSNNLDNNIQIIEADSFNRYSQRV